MVNLLHMRTFLVAYEEGSFARAARRLNYTPSAVSQQVKQLEVEFGTSLFAREGRRVIATPAGSVLAEQGVDILDRIGAMRREVEAASAGDTGFVHLGSFASAAAHLAPAAFQLLTRHRPHITVTLQEGEPGELIPLLGAGELDVVLAYEYVGQQERTELVRIPLWNEPLVLLVGKDRLAHNVRTVHLNEFAKDSWISLRRGNAGEEQVRLLCDKAGFAPNVEFRCNNYEVIRSFVRRNLGVAIVPAMGGLYDPSIVRFAFQESYGARYIYAMRRRASSSALLSDVVAAFKSCIAESVEVLVPEDTVVIS